MTLPKSPSRKREGLGVGASASEQLRLPPHLFANQASKAGFNRARVSIRVLIAEIDRSTTLRDSGVRYCVA